MTVLAICPSRGRPDAARATLQSFLDTRHDASSRLVFVVDRDDEAAEDYPTEHTYIIQPAGTMGGALRAAMADEVLKGDASVIGMVGDDNRFISHGWDVSIRRALEAQPGVAYGDDLFQHERLPTAWWLSREVADVFGLAPPWLKHFYMDNFWLEMGKGTGCIQYLPNVVIEHLHPLAGKAEDDAIYTRNGRHAGHDRQQFRMWQRRRMNMDIARLARILSAGKPSAVLADWHHPALWESLRLLFEERLGLPLYSPMGMEWREHGWRLTDGTPGWRMEDYLVYPDAVDMGTHYELTEADYPQHPRKLLTRAQANQMRFAFVVSSVAVHQRSFARLAQVFGAQPVHQVGNARHYIDRSVRQFIISNAEIKAADVVYHQEFDIEMFHPAPPGDRHAVRSFMLRIDTASCEYHWLAMAPGVDWRAYGAPTPRSPGYLAPMSRVADEMRHAGWIWHDKRIGDGYGHVIWNAAAIGRPLIGHASHYVGLPAEELWEDGVTCIDLDEHDHDEALALWYEISADPARHEAMCAAMRERFAALVDFDAEAQAIKDALM